MEVRFNKDTWKIDFLSKNRLICTTKEDGIGVVQLGTGDLFMAGGFSLAANEKIYGFGERFGPYVKNGQRVVIWNEDAGANTDMSYKNIPFYLSSNGYGLLVNSSKRVEYEIGTEEIDMIKFTVPGQELDLYFIYGPSPKEILEKYTWLTGRSPRIPKWSLGLWLTTSFLPACNERAVEELVSGMESRGIPLSVFHFDSYWMRERHWCDFTWDTRAFPRPKEMIEGLKKKGIRVSVWINPYISELSALFPEGAAKGYFVKRRDGSVYQIDWWQPGMAFVDFTNPEACKWYKHQLRRLLDMGVDSFKADFGESLPADAVCHDGSDGQRMHNLYALLYTRTVFEVLEEALGKGQAIVFARSATAGSQAYPIHWGGDSKATYASMAAQLRAGLSFCLSGGAFWSHDIGGFFGEPSPDLYKRWVAFGLLSTHSRLHGCDTHRVPWRYDEESVAVLKKFTELKLRLIPYIYSFCEEAAEKGYPVMRPMLLEFPEDEICLGLDRQYMLGDGLLVAPVFNADGIASYYLPEGVWTDFWSGRKVKGGRWMQHYLDYLHIPFYIRENSIIPLGDPANFPDGDSLADLEILVTEVEGEKEFVLADGKRRVRLACRNEGGDLVFTTGEPLQRGRVIFSGCTGCERVLGSEEWSVKDGRLVVALDGAEIRVVRPDRTSPAWLS
ncbi:MAG: alpha-xylosidase [Bacillus sp. (in: Bacteria)]|nr:alpha-xylosidase [Bacillus sp. (in: firmicutes)]